MIRAGIIALGWAGADYAIGNYRVRRITRVRSVAAQPSTVTGGRTGSVTGNCVMRKNRLIRRLPVRSYMVDSSTTIPTYVRSGIKVYETIENQEFRVA